MNVPPTPTNRQIVTSFQAQNRKEQSQLQSIKNWKEERSVLITTTSNLFQGDKGWVQNANNGSQPKGRGQQTIR